MERSPCLVVTHTCGSELRSLMQVIVFLSDIIESQFTMLHGEAVITQSGEPGVWAVGGGGLQG